MKRFSRDNDRFEGRNFGPRQVTKHKAVCSDCKKDCEVPFKPTEGRPVYCKECYPKLKAVPWAQVPHKSLRIECPLDGDIAWLNINGIVFCSKGHFVTLTTEAIQEVQPKLAKIRVYP